MTTIKIKYRLVIHPETKTLGYFKENGKFVKILTRTEYEELEIIKGGEKSGDENKTQRN